MVMPDEMTEQERQEAAEAEMAAAGVSTHSPVQQDYFGFGETKQCFFGKKYGDTLSYVEHKTLNEGARRRYMNAQNREVTIGRQTGDMRMKLATGDELHVLLEEAIVGWNLVRGGSPITFSKGSPGSTLAQFLANADPAVVDEIAKDVRKANPWLLADVTIEGIDEQIAELNETRARLVREQEGNGTSSLA
jgi:hypothetical protein